MAIRVGGSAPIGSTGPKSPESQKPIEATILAIRPARSGPVRPPKNATERRKQQKRLDPRGGRVLVLMIPDGHQLPEGVDRGIYRVFLRFARR